MWYRHASDFHPDQAMRLDRGDAQIDDQVFDGQAVKAIFETFQPGEEFIALVGGHAFGLVREIGADIAIGKNNFPGRQRRFDFGFGLQAISRVEQRGEMRVDFAERAEFAVEKARHKLAEERFVAREADAQCLTAARFQGVRQQIELRALSRAVDSFEGD